MIRRSYRAAASLCAEIVMRTPLERQFVEIGGAAWSRPFIGRFYRSTAVRLAEGFRTVSVRIDTFDGWFGSSALPRMDLVKIDVEGAEERVVAGMAATLASGKVSAMICETVWGGPTH